MATAAPEGHLVVPVHTADSDSQGAPDESQPLLLPADDDDDDQVRPATAASRTARKRLRHGRGPIIHSDDDGDGDDDDDDDQSTVTATANLTTTTSDDPEAALLVAPTKPDRTVGQQPQQQHKRRRRGRGRSCASWCCAALGTAFLVALVVLAVLHLWVGHLLAEERTRNSSPELFVRRGLILTGPSAVRIVTTPSPSAAAASHNAVAEAEADGEIVIEVDVVMGMDVRKGLDWQDKDAKEGTPTSWRKRTEAKLVRWAVSRADHVDVSVSGISLYPAQDDDDESGEPVTAVASVQSRSNDNDDALIRLDPTDAIAFSLPLSYPSPPSRNGDGNGDADEAPRTDSYTFVIPLRIPNPRHLVEFGKLVYDEKRYHVKIEIDEVIVKVGGGAPRRRSRFEKWFMDKFVSRPRSVRDLVRVVDGQLPDLPAPPQDPSKMVDLISVSVFESPSPLVLPASQYGTDPDLLDDLDRLDKAAAAVKEEGETVIAFAVSALLENPLRNAIKQGKIPPVSWSMPFRLPIEISLPLPPAPVPDVVAASNAAAAAADEEPEVALARISLAPFGFDESTTTRRAELSLTGYVVPAGNLTPSNPPSPPTRDPSDHHGDRHLTSFAASKDDADHRWSLAPSTSTRARATAPQAPLSRALSRFVARYLSGRPNDVFIRYDSGSGPDGSPARTIPSDPARDVPLPPAFVADLVRDRVLRVSVPGTNETPELFKDLRMEDMKVKLGGRGEGDDADLLASGRVVGEVVLPEMAQGLADGIDAKWIWPDVLVYEGDLPRSSSSSSSSPEIREVTAAEDLDASSDQVVFGAASLRSASTDRTRDDLEWTTQYPPSPIPATAFARMRPSSSMQAETIHVPANATHAARTLVSASFVDAPLYLLPNRGDVLRRFIGKIIFGGKATASMKGLTSVRIGLTGFGEVELVEIPIEASFLVGRGGVQNPPSLAELVGLA
ncbi:hypothetical protein JCM3774_004366 [Rhodotorula dairenensis]